MIRVKRIKAKDYYGDVEVTVRVNSQCLTKYETDNAITDIADGVMLAINSAKHFKVPMSKISVT